MSACECTASKLERMERRMAELELEVSNLRNLSQYVAPNAALAEAERLRQSGEIGIKVSLNDDIRLIKIDAGPDLSFSRITSLLERTFDRDLDEYLRGNYEMVIKYTDADGDLVTIAKTADLDRAREISPILKLTISRKKR